MTVVSTATRGNAATAALRSYGPAIAIVAVQQIFFPAPAGIVVRGLVVGGLTAMVALGMALVYRANRIINFAQADLGLAPTILAFLLIDQSGLPYPVAAVVGLAAAVALGATTERVVIRRFAHSPRLLVTVATIGLSQVLVAVAALLPRLWDLDVVAGRIAPPFDATRQIGTITFDANDLLGLVVTPIVLVAVNVFLRRSDAGTAIRASADSADRAALLGVPVARLQTLVWSVAGALAFTAVFLRSGILDVPSTATTSALGFGVLLRALVALLLGRLTDLPGVTSAAVALGVLELGIGWSHDVSLIDPVLGLVVLVAVVWRRREVGRVDLADAAAWKAADEIRPVPAVLARAGGAQAARWGVVGLGGGGGPRPAGRAQRQIRSSRPRPSSSTPCWACPWCCWPGGAASCRSARSPSSPSGRPSPASWCPSGAPTSSAGSSSPWSWGPRSLRSWGSRRSGSVASTSPSPRSPSRWPRRPILLDDDRFGWVPDARIERAPLLGGLEVSSEAAVYYLALAVFVLVGLGLRGVRTSRFGRALVGVRDNEAAAESYAVDPIRLRLVAFSLSGAIAALAGGLFVHHERAFDPSSYSALENLVVLTMVVIGGMTSVAGALLGALALLGSRWFLDPEWQFLASGLGVLLILLLAPGGLAGLAYRARDAWLRRVARRDGLRVAGFGAPAPRRGARATGRRRSSPPRPRSSPPLLRASSCRCAGSRPGTAASRSSPASTWWSTRARPWPCSAPTAPASRRCSGRSRAWCR